MHICTSYQPLLAIQKLMIGWLWQGSKVLGGRFADEQAARQAAITLYNKLVPGEPHAYIRHGHDEAAAVPSDSSSPTNEPVHASALELIPDQSHSDSEQASDADVDIADDPAVSHVPLLPSQEQPELAGADASRRLPAQAPASSRPAQRTDLLACPSSV